MNKIFKVIWNQSLGVWVAVSELAKGYSKSTSSIQSVDKESITTLVKNTSFILSNISLGLITLLAADAVFAGQVGNRADRGDPKTIVIGEGEDFTGLPAYTYSNTTSSSDPHLVSPNEHSIAIGGAATVWNKQNSIALGHNAVVWDDYPKGNFPQAGSIALGAHSVAGATNTGNTTKSIEIGGAKYTFAGQPGDSTPVLSIGSGSSYTGTRTTRNQTLTRDYQYRQIQNVAAGSISNTSTDAINGSQLYAVIEALGNMSGDAGLSNFTLGAGKANEKITVNKDADKNHFDIVSGNETYLTTAVDGRNVKVDLTEKTKNAIDQVDQNKANIANNTKNITNNTQNIINLQNEVAKGWNVTTSKSGTGNVNGASLSKVAMGETVTIDAGDNINITQTGKKITIATSSTPNFSSVNSGNLTIRPNGKVDFGNNRLTNVANGTSGTDAVNLNQLNASMAKAKTEVKAGNNVNVTKSSAADGHDVYTVNADKSTVSNGSDKVKVTSTVGANNTTNYAVDLSDTAKQQLAKEESVNSTTSNLIVTENGKNSTGGKNYSVNLNTTLDLTNAGSVKTGDTVLNSTGVTIKNGPSVTNTGVNAGNKKVTNVTNGTIAPTSTDAVNGSQLYATNQNVTNLTTEVNKGWNVTTSKSGTGNVSNNTTAKVAMGDTVTLDAGDNINITQSGKKVTIATSSTPNFSSVNSGNLTIRPNGKVDFGNNTLTNVAAPTNNTDVANKKYVDDGRTTVNSTDGSVTVNGTGTNPKNYDLSVNMSKVANDVKLKYKGDNNTSGENKLADTVTFKGSTDIVTNASNGQVAFDLADATKNKINNAIQNFTVGADKNNTAAGVNVTNGGRFDIVGKEGNYIETNVSGSNITVALNQNATEAIEKAHKGFSLKAQDGNNVTKQLGEAIEVEGGNSNINTTVENGKLKVNLNNTLDLSDVGSVKLGDTTLNSTGLTINNGPKVTKDGIDAGNKKVTNVTEGELSNTSKDAVNGSQLYATNQNVTNISNEVAKGWNITTSKSGTGNVANNTTENVKMGELVTIEAGDNINITQAAKKITIAASLTPNFTNVTTGNLTVNPNGKVDFGGNNLSNVGTPVADNDATTKKYVDDGRTTVNSTDGSVNVTKSDSSNPTNYDLSVNMSKVAQDVSFKYKGDNNTTGENKLSEPVNFKGSDYVTTNASNGTVAFDLSNNTKQKIDNAIQNFTVGADKANAADGLNITNGGRFDIVGKDGNYIETNVSGSNITVALNQNATEAIEKAHKGFSLKAQDGNNVTKQLGEAIEIEGGNSNINTTVVDGKVKVNLNNSLDLTEAGNVKIGDVNLTKEGLTINGGPNVTKVGIDAGSKKITNVADGDIAENSKDAVNGGQLYTAIKDSGFNLATNGEDVATDKRINNNETFNLNQSTNILVKQVDNGYEIATADNVTFTNITVGKDGKDGVIGVNGADGKGVVLNGKDGSIGLKGKDGVSANFTVANGTGTLDEPNKGKEGIERLVYNTTNKDGTTTTREIATKDDGLIFKGDDDKEIAKKLGSTLNITGGANKDALTDKNIGVNNENGTLTVKLAKDLNLTENGSVKIGDVNLSNGGLTITGGPNITKDGINAGNKTITNVANGTNPTDAVNLSQLNASAKAAKTEVVAGRNVNVTNATGDAGQTIYTVNAEKSVVSNGSSNITVTATPNATTGITDYSVDLSDETKAQIKKEESVVAASDRVTVTQTKTNATGGKEFEVDVNAQKVVEAAQLPVVYTNKDGDKLVKVGDKFYKSGDVTNGTVNAGATEVPKADVIASLNNGDNNTTAPMTLSNLQSTLDKATNTTTSNPDKIGTKYDNATHNAATVGDVLNAGWNLKNNGKDVDFVTHGNSVNFNDGQGVKVSTDYNSTTGTTNITFNTTNSYVDSNGNPTTEPSNKVKFIGAENDKPVSITNVDSGVLPNNKAIPEGKSFNDVLNNITGSDLNNVVNVGDLQNATKNIMNTSLQAVGFALKTTNVSGTNGVAEELTGLTDEGKRLTNNETFNLNASNNIQIKQVENGFEVATTENVTFTNITVGKDGKDGTIGVNGQNGTGVVLNGKDGTIGINGKDGASANFTVANGTGTLDTDDKGGNGIERLVYNTTNTDGSTTTREIATKDDGLKFKGDKGDAVAKKLGETLNITGGVSDEGKLTDNNIGVITKDGNLTVKLAKDLNLTDNGSVTIGDVNLTKEGLTIANGPSITKNGIDAGDKKITNVTAGALSADSKDAVNGSQLYATNQNVTNITNEVAKGWNLTTSQSGTGKVSGNSTEKVAMGETVTIEAGDNINITQSGKKVTIATSNNITVGSAGKDGQDGVDGTIGVNGKDGSAVVINGKDGSIGLTGPKGENGKDGASIALNGKDGTIGINGKNGASANFTVANGTGTLDTDDKGGNGIERLVYNTTNTDGSTTTREIATKDDGLKFKGDNGDEIAKKLGETLNITGGLTDSNKLTDNNLGVINQAGGLVVKLAKELNLTKDGSLTIGNTTLNDNGFTLVGGPNITTSGIDAGDKKITNVSDGNVSSGSKEAINGGQLYTAITNSGFNLTTKAVAGTNGQSSAEGLSDEDKRLANNETFTLDAGNNLVIKQIANGYEIATSNNITVGAAGQDGVDGTIGVNGKDGSAVVINGKDGSIGLTGPKGADGKGAGIALNGKDGTIGINGKDGASANFTVANGTGTLDTPEKGGNGIERLVYNTTNTDGTTTTREIATKDDGLKFKGDKGDAVAKKLGETLNITGGVSDEAKLTDNNIGVITKDGNLAVKLAKDLNLTENGSLAIGNVTLNKDGFNAGNTTITNVKGNLDAVTNDTTSNPDATGDKYANITHNAATVGDVLNAGWNLKENGNAVDFVTHGNTVNFKNGQGVKVGTTYNSTTGTTDITFNTTNSYVDDNGNATAEPTNKVKFIGGNASAPVSITNVDSGVLPNNASLPEGKTFNDVLNNLTGDALTNVVNAGDLKNATKDITNSTLNAVGFTLASKAVADTNGQSSEKEGLSEADKRLTNNETFTLDAGNNVRIKQIENGYEVSTADNVTFTNITVGKDGKDGVDGTIGVNGKDGASVVLNGKDGSIGLTGPKGADGKNGASANFTVVNGTGTLDDNGKGKEGITRLVYNTTNTDGTTTTREIATKDDGLKFKGDSGDEIAKKLGETLNITGGLTDSNKLTDNNLGVINQAGGLVVKLAKELNLTKDGSLTIGNTTLNDNGFTLVGGPNITTSGIDAGDKKITNVSDGNVSSGSKEAINGGQLYTAITNSGFNLTTKAVAGTNGQSSAEGLSDEDKRLANNETFTLDAGNNLVIKQIANGYEIATSNNITVGAAGQDGVDGTIGVNGKDGSAVVINGKDGSIGLTGPKGADGKDGVSANISVEDGAKGLDGNDGKNGESKTRIEYVKPDGKTETIATLNDGLKFKGDDGKEIAKKLNETLNITGGADKDKLTDGNIGVNNNNGTLEVKLSKDLNLTENGSLTIGNVILNKDGFNAGNTTITNVKGNLDAVTNNTTSNPDTTGDKYANITHNAATVGDVLNAGWNLQNNGDAVDFVTHGNTVNFVNGQGVKVDAVYNNATGTTNITFNTTNSYVGRDGNLTNDPTNKVKFIGGNASAPVSITNVDSGVLPNGTTIAGNQTFNEVLNNLTGDALTNVVNAGDLKNATKDITNTTLQAVGFALKSAKVAGSNGMVETASDLNEAGKRLTNNETFNLNAGNNIVIKQINDGYEIATANNITVGAAGKDGVDGTIGVNGKDGSAVVINGKDGSIGLTGPKGADGKGAGIALNGKDGTIGINGKDGASANFTVANGTGTLDTDDKGGNGIERLVYNTTNTDGSTTTREIATKDDGLKFKGDKGDAVAKKLGETLNITGGVSDEAKLTDNNIGVITKDGNLTVKLAKDLNLTKDGSVTIGNTTLNDKGLTIAGGPSVTVDGINAGDKQITNVANGTNATDAVNLSQLNASMAAATTEVVEGKNVTVTNTTVADGHKIYTVNAEKSIVKGSDNVSVIGKTDAANFTTTYEIDLSDAMKKQIAKEESVTAGDKNVKVVENGTNSSGGKDFAVSLNKDLNLTKDGSVTIGGTTLKEGNLTMGNTTIGNDGLTIKEGPSITQSGIDAGNKVVNNVADGDISPNSKQAVNGGQLYTAIKDSGFNLATNGQDVATDKRINNNETFNLNQGNNIVVKQIDNGFEISTGNNLVIGEKGEPGQNGQPGKDGIDGTIGVNGKDGSSVVLNGKDGSIGLTGPRGLDGQDGVSADIIVKEGAKGLDGNDGKDGESKTRIEYVKQDGSTETVATLNDGLEFMGDTGTVSKQKLNSRVNVVGGQTDATKLSDKANIGVVSDGKGTLSVKLAKDVDLGQEGSVTIGDTIINNDGVSIKDGPSINSKGINAGSKVISNVAPGVKGTDAVNVSQLKEMGNQIGRHINSIDNKVNKNRKRSDAGISGVAAMSNIPQVMLPGKSGLGVGVGTKNGQSAIAVGYSRASDNGRHIIKVSTSYDSQKNFTGGAGYMYQW